MHIQWTGSLRGLLAALVALFLLGCEEAADAGKTAEAPAEVGFTQEIIPPFFSVKEAV
ncbi:hypothetical protein K3Z86_11400, partial [Pseudomonas aeruginosa]|nr:hypothetical protein [Pseudomonas aeruginosa]